MKNKSFIERHENFHAWYRNSFLYKPVHAVMTVKMYAQYKTVAAFQYLVSIPRAIGFKDQRFLKLKSYQNKYKGKRCFIACTGPSLTISDLEMLKDEYVFGMNSISLIHDKTDWKPDFYGIQDTSVYEKIKDSILTTDNGIVFAPYDFRKYYNTPSDWVYWHMCGKYHIFEMIYTGKYFTKFSDDCYACVYDGYSITYALIQIAIYMGFDEIYLLGADCSYLGQKQHFVEHGSQDPSDPQAIAERLFTMYNTIKVYSENHGIKVMNVTRGGCLEIFPRMNLEDVIIAKEKNKIYK